VKKTIVKRARTLDLATLAHVTGRGFSTSPVVEGSSFIEENLRPKGSVGTSPS
jgi:hypothetical protein